MDTLQITGREGNTYKWNRKPTGHETLAMFQAISASDVLHKGLHGIEVDDFSAGRAAIHAELLELLTAAIGAQMDGAVTLAGGLGVDGPVELARAALEALPPEPGTDD